MIGTSKCLFISFMFMINFYSIQTLIKMSDTPIGHLDNWHRVHFD